MLRAASVMMIANCPDLVSSKPRSAASRPPKRRASLTEPRSATRMWQQEYIAKAISNWQLVSSQNEFVRYRILFLLFSFPGLFHWYLDARQQSSGSISTEWR